jgi:hypothetical protein
MELKNGQNRKIKIKRNKIKNDQRNLRERTIEQQFIRGITERK